MRLSFKKNLPFSFVHFKQGRFDDFDQKWAFFAKNRANFA